jgi:hypothetical protein
MVNGYSAMADRVFQEEIYEQLRPINTGDLPQTVLDALARWSVSHLLLHEDTYTEKVSPFPFGLTLRRLYAHPRLSFLERDGNVWAFRVLDQPRDDAPAPPQLAALPVRKWEFEAIFWHEIGEWIIPYTEVRYRTEHGTTDLEHVAIRDAPPGTVCGPGYLALDGPTASFSLRPAFVSEIPGLHWLVRARGDGEATFTQLYQHGVPGGDQALVVNDQTWQWYVLPVEEPKGGTTLGAKINWVRGHVDLDVLLLTNVALPEPAPGNIITWAATDFFHYGWTDLERNRVMLRKDYEIESILWYGPALPLPGGDYRAELRVGTDAAPGTVLGRLEVEIPPGAPARDGLDVVAGQPAMVRFRQEGNLPVCLTFSFARAADMALDGLVMLRTDGTDK